MSVLYVNYFSESCLLWMYDPILSRQIIFFIPSVSLKNTCSFLDHSFNLHKHAFLPQNILILIVLNSVNSNLPPQFYSKYFTYYMFKTIYLSHYRKKHVFNFSIISKIHHWKHILTLTHKSHVLNTYSTKSCNLLYKIWFSYLILFILIGLSLIWILYRT